MRLGSKFPSVVALLAAASVLAWTRPQAPTSAKPVGSRADQLDYVVLSVNGERRIVHAGEEHAVVRGDRVEVLDAALIGRGHAPRELNVIGYIAKASTVPNDDRGTPFDTGLDLNLKHSEDGKGDLYAVLATSRTALHGAIYLKLLDPVLRYAELSINGKTIVLRDGELVTVGAKDKVKVQKVVTNLQSNDGVIFQIAPAEGEAGAGADYQIRFLRGDRPFAAIPLKVKG